MKKVQILYIPRELEVIQNKLQSIIDDYITTTGPEANLTNAIIVRLHKAGYKIVKVGK